MTNQRWVDEDDIELIDAIHLNPRAQFEHLGDALGVSSVTVARRWRRLVDNGEAWVSSAPGRKMPLPSAIVRLACEPSQTMRVASIISQWAHVTSVHITTGRFAMYALVVAADLDILHSVCLDELGAVEGVTALEVGAVVRLYGGAAWALGVLGPVQRGAVLPEPQRSSSPESLREVTPEDQALFVALQHDGRAGFRQLARMLDSSEKVVKRRLERLVRDEKLTFRTDFSRLAAGWAAQLAFWARVPENEVDKVGSRIAAWPEVRVCAGLVSPGNLFFTMQIHQLEAVTAVLARLADTFPNVRIVERHPVVRSAKSWGRLLGRDGRATGVVAVNPWAAPGS